MTTMAYSHKLKQIAIDSRITAHGVIRCDSYDKIIRNDLGTWFFSGNCCDHLALSLMKHDDHCEVAPQSSALLINEGEVYMVLVNDGNYCEWFKTEHDCAYGSGQDFAIAALDFGKTPKEAVEYAMTRDSNTGGNVQVVDV